MSVIDEVLTANEIYARTHELRKLTPRPERKLAVLTCMDTRLSISTLGLKTGDAHIIRNAGGIVTDDTLRSLIVSHYLLGTEEIMVINHTDCGLMHTNEQDLRTRIQNRAGNRRGRAGVFLHLSEHRGKCPTPIAETSQSSVDSGKHRGARICLRRDDWTIARNQGFLTANHLAVKLPRHGIGCCDEARVLRFGLATEFRVASDRMNEAARVATENIARNSTGDYA